ncbi:serine protease family protein [Martelella soudanensis]|uniref:hypothetical protein n=1 Tax=unclassified Martelella TaxID=2629616 RepID=UPI0015DE4100|nr:MULTISPECIES: hypothetical protein [unclassified Martelella]
MNRRISRLPVFLYLLFAGWFFFSAASAATFVEPVDAGRVRDRSLAAIVTGVDDVVCTGTVIGPRHVLTAASCVIDPETGAPFRDRQIMPRIDLDDGYIPAARRFVRRVYLPAADASFGPGGALESQLAIVEVIDGQPAFSEVTSETGFHYGHAGNDGLDALFYDAVTGGQMTSVSCAALSIEAGDLMPLSCSLPEGAAGAAIRSASGIVGIYLGPGRGRYIGKAEQEGIGRIITGLQPGHFRVAEAGYAPFISFVLANACDRPISYVARYRPIAARKDQPFATVSGEVDGGASAILPFKTENGVIYLRGMADGGRLTWGGDHRFAGEGYFKVAITDWGDHFHALSCGE